MRVFQVLFAYLKHLAYPNCQTFNALEKSNMFQLQHHLSLRLEAFDRLTKKHCYQSNSK
jgi:hypothetical protein